MIGVVASVSVFGVEGLGCNFRAGQIGCSVVNDLPLLRCFSGVRSSVAKASSCVDGPLPRYALRRITVLPPEPASSNERL